LNSPAPLGTRQEVVQVSEANKVKGPASYFPSIEKTYGRSIDDWMKVLEGIRGATHMEKVAALKSQHGVGHGHANALVAHHRAQTAR
jgi:Domain of unknown function (DUF4287)